MEAGSAAVFPTAAADSAPDDWDAADSGAVDSGAMVAAVHRYLACLPVGGRRPVYFPRPALPGWVCHFGHSAPA
jgi:hypothetical protein